IRFALGVDSRLPAGRERLRVDLVEVSDGEKGAGDAAHWRREHGPAKCGERPDDDEEREHESNWHVPVPPWRLSAVCNNRRVTQALKDQKMNLRAEGVGR